MIIWKKYHEMPVMFLVGWPLGVYRRCEPFRVSSKRWSVSVLKNMKYRGKNKGALVFKSANECKQLNKRLLTVSSNEFRETFLLSVCAHCLRWNAT